MLTSPIRACKICDCIKKFNIVFLRVERKISTAKRTGEQVYWKKHKQWYLRYIKEIRHILKELHEIIGTDTALNNSFNALQQALEPILDINSLTVDKYSSICFVREKWNFFKKELEDKIRAEYDVFPKIFWFRRKALFYSYAFCKIL